MLACLILSQRSPRLFSIFSFFFLYSTFCSRYHHSLSSSLLICSSVSAILANGSCLESFNFSNCIIHLYLFIVIYFFYVLGDCINCVNCFLDFPSYFQVFRDTIILLNSLPGRLLISSPFI